MRPLDRLRQAADDLAYILDRNGNGTIRFAAFHATLTDRTPDGYSPGGEPGPRSSDISDPTHGTVIARERITATWAEIETLTRRIQADTRALAVAMTSTGEAAIDTTQRCTGAPHEPWGDATCTNNAVRSGLCWKCIKRGQRWHEAEIGSFT